LFGSAKPEFSCSFESVIPHLLSRARRWICRSFESLGNCKKNIAACPANREIRRQRHAGDCLLKPIRLECQVRKATDKVCENRKLFSPVGFLKIATSVDFDYSVAALCRRNDSFPMRSFSQIAQESTETEEKQTSFMACILDWQISESGQFPW
jgi:hypothetical protein